MRKLRAAGLAAIVGSALLVLAGCSPSAAPQSAAEPLVGDAPEGFAEFYGQQVDFAPCEADQVTLSLLPEPTDLQNYECATLEAPLDWEDAASEPIDLAVARYSAKGFSGAQAPSLFYNLGGPGGDAVNSLSAFVTTMAPKTLVDGFQVVAVDPRGVGASSPVTCWDDSERDDIMATTDLPPEGATLEERVAFYQEEFFETGTQCGERSGAIIGFIDTVSAARDFDMVRAVLGQQKMDYLGFSYGTMLGATYAELFPTKVGRFVLDAALDPAMNINQVTAAQAQGMEEALYHWIESCQKGDGCPVTGDLEAGKQQMIDFFESLAEQPLKTSDPNRPLTETLARTGVIGSLYSTSSYEYLTIGMQMALAGDGSTLLLLADFYNGRNTDGSYANSQDAFTAINALDYEPVGTPAEWQTESERLAAEYPVLGGQFGFGSAGLETWPFPSRTARHKITAPGTPEILVVGTTHDPATPYVMAENLAAALEGGVLLTWDGWGHSAYSRDGSACIQGVVDAFLLEGTVPEDGVVCSD